MDFYCFDSPVGYMALAAEEGRLVRVYLPNAPTPRLMPRETPLLKKAAEELSAYLSGTRRSFDLPLAPEGTDFQKKVWRTLEDIPRGETRSYADVARAVGCPGGARAVGAALAANPLPILIPCHRVVGADGSPGGYSGGAALKKMLLLLEGYVK